MGGVFHIYFGRILIHKIEIRFIMYKECVYLKVKIICRYIFCSLGIFCILLVLNFTIIQNGTLQENICSKGTSGHVQWTLIHVESAHPDSLIFAHAQWLHTLGQSLI